MVELLQDKDIVITSNEIRNQILKELTKILFNIWSPEAITLSIFFLFFRYSM